MTDIFMALTGLVFVGVDMDIVYWKYMHLYIIYQCQQLLLCCDIGSFLGALLIAFLELWEWKYGLA